MADGMWLAKFQAPGFKPSLSFLLPKQLQQRLTLLGSQFPQWKRISEDNFPLDTARAKELTEGFARGQSWLSQPS